MIKWFHPASSSGALIFSITYDKSCLIFKILLHYLFIRACNSSVSMNIKFIDLFIATLLISFFLLSCSISRPMLSLSVCFLGNTDVYNFCFCLFLLFVANALTFMTAYLFQVVGLFVSHLSSIL